MFKDFFGSGKTHCGDVRRSLLQPFRRRMLHVAVGEDNAVPGFFQPDGKVNSDGRFPDASFGISNGNNHEPMTYQQIRRNASMLCGCLDSKLTSWQVSMLADQILVERSR